MASELEVFNHIKSNYEFQELEKGTLQLEFQLGDGRSQLVFAAVNELGLLVSSPFAAQSDLSAMEALKAANGTPLGVKLFGEFYTLAYFAPIEDIDESEVDSALKLTAIFADGLEKDLVGGDRY